MGERERRGEKGEVGVSGERRDMTEAEYSKKASQEILFTTASE